MKKIIDGKRYDTEAATSIASYEWGNPSDFHHVSEELYLTTNGKYFLHGKGGSMSKYRESVTNNSWEGGETILPFSKEEAIAWLEVHGKTKALEKHFPESIQDA
jgi:hypothetical protein